MLPLLSKFFDSNDREVKRYAPIIADIAAREEALKKLKDAAFPKKTAELKERVAAGESLDAVLPEAFALVREAARRTVGLRHFDVQLMAATVLAKGKIAEQKTGEGKTMSAVPAMYLHALTGRGVHLVTVNDYLARRDAGWMGPIFDLLGMTVASIINDQSFFYDTQYINKETDDYRLRHLKQVTRKEAYQADVVYGINSEFGFDYLRDNMAQNLKDLVQREYYYAIVDEVDSVLIDEARTPHIISAPDEEPSAKYYEYAKVIDKLLPDTDYKIDEKLRTAHLTDHGIGKIEKLYNIRDIYEKDFDTVFHLEAALKARTLFQKEKDYIVKDNQVILVDEFTGRLMEGRRLSEGIHQAIEAKENVPIQRESKTLATVSLQNYFRKYFMLAGMTGTAVTEAEEFQKIYKLDVVVIPTNNPVVRDDASDAVYKTTRAKMTAVVEDIAEANKKGQPILVGTTSIDKNQILSELLKRRGIKHEVLNAKNHVREAQIIAQAGRKSAVTVATNMAGRGVDIILGGESPKSVDGKSEMETAVWKKWKKEHDEVISLGGLYVIGTERHESRRIDNQLRGRSGRQGDPGRSQFFVALDDDIMRLFGGDRIAGIMTRFNMPEDVPLSHGLVTKAIENAQVKVEGFNFDIRKHLVEYDDVLNKQREIIYTLRRKVLEAGDEGTGITSTKSIKSKTSKASDTTHFDSLREEVTSRIEKTIATFVTAVAGSGFDADTSENEKIISEFVTIVPFDEASQKQLITQLEQQHDTVEKTEFLTKIALDIYAQREQQMGDVTMRQIERFVMLSVIDNLWMNHLDAMDNLRQGIGLRGYAQKDPLVEYKNEGYRMFETLVFTIDDEIVHRIFKVQVHDSPDIPNQKHIHVVTNTPASEISQSQTNAEPHAKQRSSSSEEAKSKLSRNDPCWCGATKADGTPKKFKHCHYPQQPS